MKVSRALYALHNIKEPLSFYLKTNKLNKTFRVSVEITIISTSCVELPMSTREPDAPCLSNSNFIVDCGENDKDRESEAEERGIFHKYVFSIFQVIILVTSTFLLQEGVGSSDYENCSKKMRQLILDSCAEPKGKRNAFLAEYSWRAPAPQSPARQSASPALLGTFISACVPDPHVPSLHHY